MAKMCPGCGSPMEYDPGFDSLVCKTCGNIVDPKTLSDADDFYHNYEGDQPVDIAETLSDEDELTGEMYDCHVYKCSQCGGEVLVSGTEISTRCVYCGSTTVVYSRIAKENRPDWIVPFSVTKEEALRALNEKLEKGVFIPKAFKNISPECVRGIYIPYFTYDGHISDTQHHTYGLNGCTVLDGSADFHNLLVECCSVLNDRITALLEPYNMNAAVDFDTSYLMGFYSNICDKNMNAIRRTADLKAKTLFNSIMRTQSPNRFSKRVSSAPKLELHRTGYVLLPAWFITITTKKNVPYTFLVNGQSGKVCGSAPFSKLRFAAVTIGACIAACAALFTIFRIVTPLYASLYDYYSATDFVQSGVLQLICGALYVACIILFTVLITRLRHLFAVIRRAASITSFIFAKKRQGGSV